MVDYSEEDVIKPRGRKAKKTAIFLDSQEFDVGDEKVSKVVRWFRWDRIARNSLLLVRMFKRHFRSGSFLKFHGSFKLLTFRFYHAIKETFLVGFGYI